MKTVLATMAAMLAIPYLAYSSGIPADDEYSQRYVQTVNGIRYHIATYSVSDSYQYEKTEILTALGQGAHIVGNFIVTLPQRIHR